LRKPFEREFAHAIATPIRKPGLGGNGKDVHDTRTRRHLRTEALHQQKRRSDVYTERLLPLGHRNFAERLYNRDAGIVG
jgi:hypothetical protein